MRFMVLNSKRSIIGVADENGYTPIDIIYPEEYVGDYADWTSDLERF